VLRIVVDSVVALVGPYGVATELVDLLLFVFEHADRYSSLPDLQGSGAIAFQSTCVSLGPGSLNAGADFRPVIVDKEVAFVNMCAGHRRVDRGSRDIVYCTPLEFSRNIESTQSDRPCLGRKGHRRHESFPSRCL
jgi:hypothetical protein